jgi:hypothetical protein
MNACVWSAILGVLVFTLGPALAQEPSTNAPSASGQKPPAAKGPAGLRKAEPPQRPAAKPKVPAPSAAEKPQGTLKMVAPEGPPPPGVYVTAPYTCIVVVPSGMIDPKMIVPAPEQDQRGIYKPDLWFIPRNQPRLKD